MRCCDIEGCYRKHYAKGLCSAHYQRNLKGKSLELNLKERGCQPIYTNQNYAFFYIKDKVVKLSKIDVPKVYKHGRWYMNTGYARSNGKYIHTLILEPREGFVIDHINGNRLDNRRENLRYATSSENNANRHTKDLGVSLDKNKNLNKRWKARYTHNGEKIWLGRFRTKVEALQAIASSKNERRFYAGH